MGNKERLKGILERQAAAAEREPVGRRGNVCQSRKSKIGESGGDPENGKNNERISKPTSLK